METEVAHRLCHPGDQCARAIVGFVGYLYNEVNRLNEKNAEDNPSAARLGVDDDSSLQQMSAYQRFFHNIGIRQDTLIQDCTENQLKHSFPNIDYAFLGYDVYRGYLLAESHDPGFRFPIFRADYSQKRQTADCRFSVPNGVLVIPDVSCVTSFVSDGGIKWRIRKELAPTFDEAFLIWLSKLDNSDSKVTYIEFMDKFGTHFVTGATFGAKFTYEHKMTSSYFKSTKTTQYSASVRASYSGLFSIGGGFSMDSEQREAASDFSKNVQTRTVTVGAAPPSNGDAMTWASTVKNDPVPTKYTLEPIENLFVPEYVNDLGIDYEAIRLNLIQYKEDYKTFRKNASRDIGGSQVSSSELELWYYNKKTLAVSNGGFRGDWGKAEFCPRGHFAIGYNLKTEPDLGPDGDDTGLNAIKLICADEYGNVNKDFITSEEGIWGSYETYDAMCPKSGTTVYFLTKFSLQMHDWNSIAAAFVTFKCQDINQTRNEIQLEIPPGHGQPWGREWHDSERCPVGTAICGIKTKVQKPQGKGDDTALNNVRFYCCGRK